MEASGILIRNGSERCVRTRWPEKKRLSMDPSHSLFTFALSSSLIPKRKITAFNGHKQMGMGIERTTYVDGCPVVSGLRS